MAVEICTNFRNNYCESVGVTVKCQGLKPLCVFPTEYRTLREDVGLAYLAKGTKKPQVPIMARKYTRR